MGQTIPQTSNIGRSINALGSCFAIDDKGQKQLFEKVYQSMISLPVLQSFLFFCALHRLPCLFSMPKVL